MNDPRLHSEACKAEACTAAVRQAQGFLAQVDVPETEAAKKHVQAFALLAIQCEVAKRGSGRNRAMQIDATSADIARYSTMHNLT